MALLRGLFWNEYEPETWSGRTEASGGSQESTFLKVGPLFTFLDQNPYVVRTLRKSVYSEAEKQFI